MSDVLLIALIAGLLAIDDRAGWQTLLGEPIFSSLVVGVLLGTVEPVLRCGVVLQLAWLTIGAARGTRRPNTVVGGVVGAGAAGLVLARTGDPRETVVVAGGVLMGLLAAEAAALVANATGRWRDRRLGDLRVAAAPAATSRKLALAVVGSALFVGVVDFLVVLALLPVAVRVVDLLALRLGAGAAAGATWWLVCVSAIGVASVVRAFRTRALVRFLVLGAVAMTALGWLR